MKRAPVAAFSKINMSEGVPALRKLRVLPKKKRTWHPNDGERSTLRNPTHSHPRHGGVGKRTGRSVSHVTRPKDDDKDGVEINSDPSCPLHTHASLKKEVPKKRLGVRRSDAVRRIVRSL